MPVSIGTLVGYLVLDDKLSPALKVAQGNVASAAKSMKELGSSMQAAGSAMLPLSAAVGAFGAGALTIFADFERGMNRVRAVTGATGTDFDALNKQAQDLGASTVFTAREAAEAMGFFGLAGFKVNEILGAMPGALQLAAAGQMQVGHAADIVAKIMRGYAMDATEVGRINDVLTKSFVSANTDLVQLGEGFKHAGPVAKQFGIQFEEASAALALMADAGFQGSLGGTSLRNALLRLQGVLPESAKLLKEIGLETQDASGKLRPLADIIEQVEQKGIRAEDMMRLLGVRGGPAFLSVIERGSGALRSFTEMLEGAGGTAARIEKIQLEGLKGQWVLLTSAAEGAAIAIGGAMAPAAGKLLGPLTELANFVRDDVVPAFQSMPTAMQTGMVGMMGAVTAAGPVLFGLGATIKAMGFAFDGLKIGIGGVVSGFGLLKQAVTGAGTLMTTFAKVNASAFGGFVPAIRTVGAELALLFPKLTLLAKGVGLVGAAFAGWQAGKWISDLKLFGDEQMSVGESFSFGLLKLQQWTGFLDASDADIENSILAQRNLGQAVQETATQVEATAEPLKSAAERVAAAIGEQGQQMLQAEQMVKQYNDRLQTVSAEIAGLSETQREAIRSGIAMEQSTEDIAKGLNLGEAAVKAYAAGLQEADKKVEKFLETTRKSREEVAKLTAEFQTNVVTLTGTDLDARLAAVDQWFTEEVSKIESTGAAYEEHYAALERMREQRKEMEQTDIAEMNKQSLEALEQQRDVAKRTYEDMMFSGLTFSREVMEGQKQKWKDLEQAVRDYGNNWEGAKQQGGNAIDSMNEKLDEQIGKLDKVKKAMESFTMDIQPLTRTQMREIASNYGGGMQSRMGGEFEIPVDALRRKLNELEELEGTYRPKSKEQYLKMINDQVLLSQLRQMDLSKPEVTQATVANQVVPTTTTGGIARSSTAATSGSRALGGGGITMNNYINGTGAQVAHTVSNELMRVLKAGRQFGSA